MKVVTEEQKTLDPFLFCFVPTCRLFMSSYLDEQGDVWLAGVSRGSAALIQRHILQSFQAVVDGLRRLGASIGVSVRHQHPVHGVILILYHRLDGRLVARVPMGGGGC